MSSTKPIVREIDPRHVVPGGRVAIQGEGFDPDRAHAHRVFFGECRAQIMRVSPDTISAVVPEDALAQMPEVRVELDGASSSARKVSVAQTIAEELQPVANPVFDGSGRLYVTLSGSRGEKTPVSVYRIVLDGDVEPYASDIMNPTGLAWGPDDALYVSSREEGAIYRVSARGEAELFADELGTATGIAFDAEGILYVGDRRGTIFRIEPNGEPRSFCRLEPSVAAYHLAFDSEGVLFVTAPSLSPVDPIYRIDTDGRVETYCNGFGRPQGLAFDEEGILYVTEGLVGASGVYRIGLDRNAERIISAPPIVGVAFDGDGGVILAGTSSIFKVDAGIRGRMPL